MTRSPARACVLVVLVAGLSPRTVRADDNSPGPAAPLPSVPGDPEPAPSLERPAGDARSQRAAIATLERLYRESGEGDVLLSMARLYEQVARQSGDERDKRLAILYYERYLAEKGGRADWITVKAALVRLGVTPRAAETLPDRVNIHFLSYRDDDIYQVRVGERECTTPCTMEVPTGPIRIAAEGSASLRLQLLAPRLSSQIRLQHDDSRGYTVSGSVLVPAGLITAAGMWALGLACRSESCLIANLAGWPIIGVATLITGIGLLTAAPRHRIAADANRFEILDVHAPARLRLTGFGLGPVPGGQGAAAAVGFIF